MYLSRVEIDIGNRRKIRDLTHLGAYHNWVEACFSYSEDEMHRERKLWRIDILGGHPYLLLQSREEPNMEMLERYGVKGSARVKPYRKFLDSIQEGKKYHFRATLNPVMSKSLGKGKRGKVIPYHTVENQMKFLFEKSEKNGFLLREDEIKIVDRRIENLKKKGMRDTSFSVVTYEGILTVTDPEVFREGLTCGIGKKKAYGCGLMTVIPLSR